MGQPDDQRHLEQPGGAAGPQRHHAESAALLNRRVIAACDTLDGVEGRRDRGSAPLPFRSRLACSAKQGDAAGECLTQAQVDAANRIYYGAHKSDGTPIFQGYAARQRSAMGADVGGQDAGRLVAVDFFRYSVFQDMNFENISFDFDKDTDRALSARWWAGRPSPTSTM